MNFLKNVYDLHSFLTLTLLLQIKFVRFAYYLKRCQFSQNEISIAFWILISSIEFANYLSNFSQNNKTLFTVRCPFHYLFITLSSMLACNVTIAVIASFCCLVMSLKLIQSAACWFGKCNNVFSCSHDEFESRFELYYFQTNGNCNSRPGFF